MRERRRGERGSERETKGKRGEREREKRRRREKRPLERAREVGDGGASSSSEGDLLHRRRSGGKVRHTESETTHQATLGQRNNPAHFVVGRLVSTSQK